MENNKKEKAKENDIDEMVLYEEGGDKNDNNNNNVGFSDTSSNREELLTLDEYYLSCCRYGDFEELKEAMKDAGKDFNYNQVDQRGNTALHLASANGFLDIVKYLINELHCEIDIKNKSLNTPLAWAAFNGQKEVVKFLLEKGADCDSVNENGIKPSQMAYDCGYFDTADLLLTKENEKHPLEIKEEKVEEDENKDENKDKDKGNDSKK